MPQKLQQGDWVVMHTCIEATDPNNYGKLWRCKTDQFTRGKGALVQDSVFLEGFSGSFAPEFLQKVDITEIFKEKDQLIKELQDKLNKIEDASEGSLDELDAALLEVFGA
jgi:hypothetical protein